MNKMRPPCESIARYLLPIVRSLVAKELVEKYGYTQTNAAKKLGTTQAAISQYLHSKRGFGKLDYENNFPEIQKIAQETAKKIVTEKMSSDKPVLSFCEICKEIQSY